MSLNSLLEQHRMSKLRLNQVKVSFDIYITAPTFESTYQVLPTPPFPIKTSNSKLK